MNALILIAVLVFSFLFQPYFVLGKFGVHIINDLGANEILNLHCKSKDNDLGPQIVAFGKEYEWRFDPNIWGTTLYWCCMDWKAKHSCFEIFKAGRDIDRSCNSGRSQECYRKVRPDGIYFSPFLNTEFWKVFSW